jgi:hypothetical protein
MESSDAAQFCDECGVRLPPPANSRSTKKTMIEENEVPPDSLAGWQPDGEFVRAPSAGEKPFAHARLLIERGKNTGKEFVLSENEIHIGRWDADNGVFPDVDLDTDDPEAKVSRRHARIIRYGDQYLIEDLGSTNGTFVNRGRRLLPGNRQVINDGDEIIVGKTFLRFQVIR